MDNQDELNSVTTVGETDKANTWNEVEKVTLSWKNINLYVNNSGKSCFPFLKKSKTGRKKHILKNLNGCAFPGSLLAIMGSSGSGKSTLLNTLTGRTLEEFRITGSILVNGREDRKKLAKLTAYVEQEDLFVGTLTVREHLIFQASLRMDSKTSYEDKLKRVEEVIREMGLSACSNNVIGVRGRIKGISGGEKKRLSFASEVLTNPSLMFCDEVTSGLDSFLCQSVVAVLKTMSDAGRTVICAIHQPSSDIYAMFDRVLFMADGRTAYFGTKEDALTFFGRLGYQCPLNYNPSDYIIMNLAVIPEDEENCLDRIKIICDEYEKVDKVISIEESNPHPNGDISKFSKEEQYRRYNSTWWTQLRNVTWRSFINSRREPLLLKLRLFQTSVSLILFSLFFWRQKLDEKGVMNIESLMFLMLLNSSFQLVISIINIFSEELPIFFKEYKSCLYGSDVFFLAKMTSELSVTVVMPAVFSGVLYWTVGLYNDYRAFLTCVGVVVLCSNATASFGYLLATFINSASGATGIASAFFMPLSLLGGFFINTGSLPDFLSWMKYISWFYYANEMLNINQWSNVKNITCTIEACVPDGPAVIESLRFDPDNFYQDLMALLTQIIGLRLLSYIILLARARRWI